LSEGADVVGRHKRLARRTFLVSALTLVSRVLGYVREIIGAMLFGGGSAVYDAFITAWRVPNLFRRFLGEGALSTSFQTALTEVDADQGLHAGRQLFHDTLRMLTWILLALTIAVCAGVMAMPDAMPLTGWQWLGADPDPVRDLIVRLMPFVLLVCISAIIGGALNVRGHFAAPAWAPAALNVVAITTLLCIAAVYGWDAPGSPEADYQRHVEMANFFAWGILVAGVVQLVVQVPALQKTGFMGPKQAVVVTSQAATSAGAVLRRSAPLALGAAVYQINVMVDGLMAENLLENGGPTAHYLANRVQQFPMALIAIAATSAVFPALKAHGHKGDRAAVRNLHDRTQRSICFVALPACAGLFALAYPVISVSFGHGNFDATGVERTTNALRMLTLAILPAGATGLVARTYYALGDFKTPVRVSSAMLALNVALNLLFIKIFAMDADGLALGTAVTSWAGLLALLPGLSRKLTLPRGTHAFASPVARMFIASLASGALAYGTERVTRDAVGATLALGVAIGVGVASYFVAAALLRVPEVRDVRDRLARIKGRAGD
jgi:putative peptidoglycan lipid II flippase